MFLIDTSVWIESFKKNSIFKINENFRIEEIYICLPIYQEILQGVRDDSAYFLIKRALDSSKFLEKPLNKIVFDEAVIIYRQAKKKGITIRSSMDCLISAIAIKNNATLIHLDRDFTSIGKFTSLKEKSIY